MLHLKRDACEGCADDQFWLSRGVRRTQVLGAEGGDVDGRPGAHSLQRNRHVRDLVAGVGEHDTHLRGGAVDRGTCGDMRARSSGDAWR